MTGINKAFLSINCWETVPREDSEIFSLIGHGHSRNSPVCKAGLILNGMELDIKFSLGITVWLSSETYPRSARRKSVPGKAYYILMVAVMGLLN